MFIEFKEVITQQLSTMSRDELFVVNVSKDELWETYLKSFPEGSNPIYKEKTEHDCTCCKQFIRAGGAVVSIVNNRLVSIWDVEVKWPYNIVAKALSDLVKSKVVCDVYLHNEDSLGTDKNYQEGEDAVITWDHFHFKLPEKFVKREDKASILSVKRSNKEVFKRSLTEITLEAIETVLELISQNSIYRGEEHKEIVTKLAKYRKEVNKLVTESEKELYCWAISLKLGAAAKIRNTVIGTLLCDISDGVDLSKAVKSFEAKVAPENYKRPTALITAAMITKAQEKVESLGIESALKRRYAVTNDITVNNVLFADRSVKKDMGIFEQLEDDLTVNIDSFDKVEEVSINTFITDVLPKINSMELLLENKHSNNLMSLIAPINNDAPNILKWNNNFSWAYNGEVTDSIKDRVKKAGGNVEGVLRCSLSWFNYDDLDIHVIEPRGNRIFYSSRSNLKTLGSLDVDMNAGNLRSRNAVENITWSNKDYMEEGIYQVIVNNFTLRETTDVGCTVEIEYEGKITTFNYPNKIKDKGNITIARFEFTRADGINFLESIASTETSKEVWNIGTHKLHKVNMLMSSPNHWDNQEVGNKHWFFILDNCKNEEKARGFFNEFLKSDLIEHRKVFEVLGSKMKTEKSETQLSGLGFSSTQRNSVLCKVAGNFSRTIKINF